MWLSYIFEQLNINNTFFIIYAIIILYAQIGIAIVAGLLALITDKIAINAETELINDETWELAAPFTS